MEKTKAKQAMEELTMLLMYLSRFCENEKFREAKDFYAWKGYDFDVLNSLDELNYIAQSSYRAKKVYLTEEGKQKAKEFLQKYHVEDW